jgi:hypothetical protein
VCVCGKIPTFRGPCWLYLRLVIISCSDMVGYHSFRGAFCLHLRLVTPCSDVVGYHSFRGAFCLHLRLVTSCSDVVGYYRFTGPYCLNLQLVTPFSDVEHQRLTGPCCIHVQVVTPCSVMAGYHRFERPCCLHLHPEAHDIFPIVESRPTNLTESFRDFPHPVLANTRVFHCKRSPPIPSTYFASYNS